MSVKFKTTDNAQGLGHVIHAVKAVVLEESNAYAEQNKLLGEVFNVLSSDRSIESILSEVGFGSFEYKPEGDPIPKDTLAEGYSSSISHKTFAKQFNITREMIEDAKLGRAATLSVGKVKEIKGFVRAFINARLECAFKLLGGATGNSVTVLGATLSAKTGDNLPLFSGVHTYKTKEGTQSNYFHTNEDFDSDAAKFNNVLWAAANKLRDFKTEKGDSTGYVANLLILPNNQHDLRKIAQTVLGSPKAPGSANNDININYGNFEIITLPYWDAEGPEFIVMSKEANEEFYGNAFYNREALSVTSHVNPNTEDLIFNGRGRFGIGFHAWKHIARVVKSAAQVGTSTAL